MSKWDENSYAGFDPEELPPELLEAMSNGVGVGMNVADIPGASMKEKLSNAMEHVTAIVAATVGVQEKFSEFCALTKSLIHTMRLNAGYVDREDVVLVYVRECIVRINECFSCIMLRVKDCQVDPNRCSQDSSDHIKSGVELAVKGLEATLKKYDKAFEDRLTLNFAEAYTGMILTMCGSIEGSLVELVQASAIAGAKIKHVALPADVTAARAFSVYNSLTEDLLTGDIDADVVKIVSTRRTQYKHMLAEGYDEDTALKLTFGGEEVRAEMAAESFMSWLRAHI